MYYLLYLNIVVDPSYTGSIITLGHESVHNTKQLYSEI